MIVSGYRLGEPLAGAAGVLRRARRDADGVPVLVKTAPAGARDGLALESLRREHEILRELALPGVPRALGFDVAAGASIVEDMGGAVLDALIASRPLPIDSFLAIAIDLARTVGELHRRRIIHKNLSPATILVHPTSNRAQIFDFTIASRLAQESQAPSPPSTLQGQLAWVSPEQTGRMNRVVDHRSDLYSLGAVFYTMLVGRPPFVSDDPLEVIHGHIARTALTPSEVDPAIPRTISDVVSKLLAKTAEERYQSAWGLTADLEKIAEQWTRTRAIVPFELGEQDVSDRFTIPQRLYGRDAEIRALLDSFDRASLGRPVLMAVAGYSGIGKTALVNEVLKPIVQRHGRFVSGKFDQLDRSTPYGALIQALRALVRQLLAESEETVAAMRARLVQSLGTNVSVIAAVVPELELLIGPQPAAPQLGATEAQNRFTFVLEGFLGVFATPAHPLVIFLDDVQWADSATLSSLMHLLSGRTLGSFLLIAAFRDNEVGPGHPFAKALAQIRDSSAEVVEVALPPLRLPHLVEMIRDLLHLDPEIVEPLARLVKDKTGGNPFFVTQFLRTLHQDGLIEFDHGARRWSFDLARIEHAQITENVVELMTRKLRGLSPATQRTLTLAACIGASFSLATLAVACERPQREVAAELWEAIETGLVLPTSDRYEQFASATEDVLERMAPMFAFLHDRVQQAAYALIPAEERPRVHLRLGRLLLAETGDVVADARVFEIADHLNFGHELITDRNEREALIRLDLAAGRRAKQSAAFHVALRYFEQGLALLPRLSDDAWRTHHELAVDLHMEVAEARHLCGAIDDAERCLDTVLARATSPLVKAEAYRLRLVSCESRARNADAVLAGRAALRLLGVEFPEDEAAQRTTLDAEIAALTAKLGTRTIASLENLPELTDPTQKMVMRLLTSMWAPAYILGQGSLAFLFSARIIRLSLEHGNTDDSAYGYVTYAIAAGPIGGDYASAYEWGSLALRVIDRAKDRRHRAKIHQQFNAHVTLWRKPWETCVTHAREACRSGLEVGDFNYAGYGALTESWAAFLIATDLDRFVRDLTPSVALLERIRMQSLADGLRVMLAWARALAGKTKSPCSLTGDDFDEADYLARYADNRFCLTFFWVAKLALAVTFDDAPGALEAERRVRTDAWTPAGTLWPVLLDFWGGLAHARAFGSAADSERARHREAVVSAEASLRRLADNCPENFRGFALMIAGERARIDGQSAESVMHFEAAIEWARRNGDVQQEALANELAARLWIERGREVVATPYLREAHRAFGLWRAVAKVEDLERRHPGVFEATGAREPRTARGFDAASALKIAHAIVAEIEIDKLLRTLIRIAIEHAGAERGLFIEDHGGRLMIVAEGTAAGCAVTPAGAPIDARRDISRAITLLAHRTGEWVIVDDAARESRWIDPAVAGGTGDPGAGPPAKSILCLPVVHQGSSGKRAGLLYLDNRLVTGAFAPERVELLQIVSSQAAIALENARLYAAMREEVERRSRAEVALKDAVAQLETLKDRLHAENTYLQEEIRTEHNFDEIVGTSPALIDALRKVEKVAGTESTVLILGETGSGKELFARAIHSRSARRARPLVKVNCGAIPAGLVESELFGHVKGAFTGALANRVGRFELADGGTLFLDEVGELPIDTQVKLLRVLQEREFEPVGSGKTVKVDVRLIAATNRDVETAVREGRFRADLLYRLNVFPIRVPPLRERAADIPLIVSFFVNRLAKRLGKPLEGFSRASIERMKKYSWPGNVRELENVVERAAIVATGATLEVESDLLGGERTEAAPRARTLEQIERDSIVEALRNSHGVVEGPRGAATTLGLHPNTLRSRIKKFGIERADYEIS